eukprot:gene3985-7938_t
MKITVNLTEAGPDVPVVESKIKRVRERVQDHVNVHLLNLITTLLFLSYGQYCGVHELPFFTNTMKSRTRPGNSLHMKENRQNSGYFNMLDADKLVSRDHWTTMPTPNWVIQQISDKPIAQKRQINCLPVFKYGQGSLEHIDDVGINHRRGSSRSRGVYASSRRL